MPSWKKLITSGSSAHLNQVTASSGIQLADDAVLNLGDGNDLQLYHDSSNSYIKDAGTGNIFYRSGTQTFQNAAGSKTMLTLNAANSVDLNYNNNTKLQTTNIGVSVTGNIVASTHVTASGNISGSSTSTGSFGRTEGTSFSYVFDSNGSLVYDGDELVLKVESLNDGWVSFVDTWDQNWSVFVNNDKKKLNQLFGAYKSVRIESGISKIRFIYKPFNINFKK